MTGKERLKAALIGDKVDRVPLWPREGFEYKGYENAAKDFKNCWKANNQYKEIYDYVYTYADVIANWSCYPVNRFLIVPEKYINIEAKNISDTEMRVEGTIKTRRGNLKYINEFQKGVATGWTVKHPVDSIQDLIDLVEIPFEIDHLFIEKAIQRYEDIYEDVGDKGLINTFLSSPIVTISGSMSFEMFLELSLTEKNLFHEHLEEMTTRELAVIDAVFGKNKLDVFVTFGGSEQCTPPMMSPASFDEFVVPYDSRIVQRLKEYNVLSTCHCHGKVRHALKGMMEIGYTGTDPVEPPPSGDVTFEEARKITEGKMTLFGNIEWSELVHKDPAYIRNRVKEILSYGSERLVVAASAGPISHMDSRTIDNYKAWIDAMFEFGTV